MVDLRTAPGDGGVSLGVDAFGSFGSAVGGDTSDAIYDPIGSEAEAGTVYESLIAFRTTEDDTRSYLNSIGENPVIAESTESTVNSTFTIGNLSFQLNQSVEDFLADGDRLGSILTQEYIIANTGTETAQFELIRYLDGDLYFDGTLEDTGGRRIRDDEEILFETDNGEDPSFATTFVGITATGGDESSPGRFEIDSYSGLRQRIANGVELDEEITGDELNNDGFVDSGPYDITLALRNSFTIEPEASATYTTETIFGTGSPGDIDLSPPNNLGDSETGIMGNLDTPVYRFRNTDEPGNYVYVGEEERAEILANHDNFTEEGYAFKVGSQPADDLIPMYRFQSNETPGTYNFVGEAERDTIFNYYNDTFTYEGIAFYAREPNSGIGMELSRFQNTANPGTYLFAGGEERDFIRAAYPGMIEEGYAFSVDI